MQMHSAHQTEKTLKKLAPKYPALDLPVFAFDTETVPTSPGILDPPGVTFQWMASWEDEPSLVTFLEQRNFIHDLMEYNLEQAADLQLIIVGHKVAYDMAILAREFPDLKPLIFLAYRAGGIHDTKLREMIPDIRRGLHNSDDKCKYVYDPQTDSRYRVDYSLQGLCEFHDIADLEKGEDSWQLRFGELIDTPLEEYPKGARDYAILDGLVTLGLYYAQQAAYFDPESEEKAWALFQRVGEESRKAFALHMTACWGLMADQEKTLRLDKKLRKELAELQEKMVEDGLVTAPRKLKSGKNKGKYTKAKRNLKIIHERIKVAYEAVGLPCPHTKPSKKFPSGQVKVDEEALKPLTDVDPVLKKLARFTKISSDLTKYVSILFKGFHNAINTDVEPMLDTGRCALSKPPIQQIPRKGGYRDCFIPRRQGFVFISVDYNTLELRTLAQSCLWIVGWSKLAESINTGLDPHLDLAAQLLNITYEEALKRKHDPEVKNARQLAKIANFGFPGGLQPEAFIEYAAGYGVKITLWESRNLYNNWKAKWPEVVPYFAHIKSQTKSNSLSFTGGTVTLHAPPDSDLFEGLTRGGVSFTQAANFCFQGPAARGAKEALFEIVEDCLVDENTPLFKWGCRVNLFMHDEIIIECPNDPVAMTECGEWLTKVMCEVMARYVPDIVITAAPACMDHWYKEAEEVRNKKGQLILWEPEIQKAA